MEFHSNGDMLQKKQQKKGGNRAATFVYVMAALDTMAFLSNAVSLVTYFSGYMNFSLTKSANTVTNFLGTAYLLSLVGGFISDTYLKRFTTCVLFGSIEVVGYALLAVQARSKELRPLPCKSLAFTNPSQCQAATSTQEAVLFIGLYLVALGVGGIKAALPSLGADQFDERDPEEASAFSSFFNWYMFSQTFGSMLGVTFLVWINTNVGWDWSFGVSAVAIGIGTLFLCTGKSLYRNNVHKGSPLVRILQVFVAAIRNRKLPVPSTAKELHQVYDKEADDEEILQKTDQFKCLDRAAIIRPSQAAPTATNSSGSWKLCTVTQVEETKILVRMLPIILSTVFMNTCLAQLQTFTIQQSLTLDRKLGSFEIPGPSIPVIPLVFMTILLPLYDKFFVPMARKFTGIPTGITTLQRVGVGLVLSAISMAVSGVVETHRKNVAREHGMLDSPGPLPMSLFWLGIQYGIFGLADMFTVVGLLEFFYSESSMGMKSLSTAISWCSLALGSFLSTVVVNIVNKASGGWLSSNNLNRDRLEYFYWLLAGLSTLNFGVYLMCSSWYKYKNVEGKQEEKSSLEMREQN